MPIPTVDFSEEIDKSMYIGDVPQLNFALWCATTGCGISCDMLFPTGYLNLSPQVRSFYLFHVYFTMRRILYEIGGIESVSALPDDLTFKQRDNKYAIAAYKKNLW